MDKTYVLYSEEYYFSMNSFSTIMRKNVYNVTYNGEAAEELREVIEESLSKAVEAGELNDKNEILSAYEVKTVALDGKLSIDEAKQMVINDDYSWGKTEGYTK